MKPRLKIGIVVDQLLAGGVQFAAIEQVKELNKLGHRATLLILMRKKYPTDFSYLVKGVPHEYLSDSYPSLFRKTIKFPIFSFLSTLHLASPVLAPRVLEGEGYDILISWGTTTSLTTQAIYRKLKIPYFAIIHDPIIYILDKVYSSTSLRIIFPILKPLARYFEGSFVRDAEKTIIISRVHYSYLKQTYSVRAIILPLGVTAPKSVPKKRGGALLSFGRWQREKNPKFLLTLLSKLPKTNLIIAGTWIDKDELGWFRKQVKGLGLTNRVEIVPHFSDGELRKLTSRARLFLHPHFEAFGLAALEAASHGLPIIIPEKSGVTEGFEHGVHGYFPKKVALGEYKKYTRALLVNERLSYKMGREAAAVVKRDFSWESNAKRLLKLIEDALVIREKPKILVIESGHAQGISLSGGDKLMEPMAIRLSDKYDFTVIVPKIAQDHWRKAPLSKQIIGLPKNRFDETGQPVDVFLTYVLRMMSATRIAKALNSMDYFYSSTNILPDVLPLYFAKGERRDAVWLARIHHLIPPPNKREGRVFVNIVSYLMQMLSLYMIKTRADVIIALNKELKSELTGKGFPEKRLRVLGAGIDFDKIDILKPKGETKKFDAVYLGRIHPTKGVFDLVPIWKKVIEDLPEVNLAIIGIGEPATENNLRDLISEKHLKKNIKVLGYVPDDKLFSIMKRAKVFLFTDHEAGWGIAVAEAMASKLPVVGYDIGILGHVFVKGYKTVPLGNYSLFSKQVVDLLQNENDRIKLAKQAYSSANQFDWSKTSQAFQQILEETKENE